MNQNDSSLNTLEKLINEGQFSQAIYEAEFMLEKESDYELISTIKLKMGFSNRMTRNYYEALDLFEEIEDDLESDSREMGQLLRDKSYCLAITGQIHEAESAALSLLDLGDRIGDIQLRIWGCNSYGDACLYLGRHKEARNYFTEALDYYRRQDNREKISACANNLGEVDRFQGHYSEALSNYQISLEMDKERDDIIGVAIEYANMSMIYLKLDQFNRAWECSELSIESQEQSDFPMSESWYVLAVIQLKRGQYMDALEKANKGLSISFDSGDQNSEAIGYLILAFLHIHFGDHSNGLAYGRRGRKILLNSHSKKEFIIWAGYIFYCRYFLTQGYASWALQICETALNEIDKSEMGERERALHLKVKSQILRKMNLTDEAGKCESEAETLITR